MQAKEVITICAIIIFILKSFQYENVSRKTIIDIIGFKHFA
jgi:hypothetical protein